MRLNRTRRGRIARTLGMPTANLFIATGLSARDSSANSTINTAPVYGGAVNDDTRTDLNMTRIDASVPYQEDAGLVRTIEPVVAATLNAGNGDVLSVKLTTA